MRLMNEIKKAILEDMDELGGGTRMELWQRCTMDVPWEPFKRILSGLFAAGLVSKKDACITLSEKGELFVQQL